ncbi:MAG: DinB family protein [Candidatus Palauibacterales bacterium]|jgi:DinB superfamily|nr:DinB family protein [Candidatus Palauibacterales bacterium]
MNGVDAGRPTTSEYDPYYQSFIDLVPDRPILEVLEEQRHELMGFLGSLDKATADYRYAPEKWSVKEVLGHVVDTERIFGARALCFARGEQKPLPPFEQDDYVRSAGFDHRALSSLTREFEAVRLSTESLFDGFDEEQWNRGGVANEVHMSVRAVAYIVVGHTAHHMAVIRERYLGGQ